MFVEFQTTFGAWVLLWVQDYQAPCNREADPDVRFDSHITTPVLKWTAQSGFT